ncbi:hypothetical protein PACTADRAFT_2932 [Pachysolen tannophilus NRRL Y-2460]|uniref:Signal peptide peptidase n=1 Tax=Pachysolen tannophilus NRRL Y-2460 TaxID=669874 RepID=A0A1E4TU11_PACTA|nr:hypothetical protein PACTADRAFT_2932 [Pachysolen tannophilus NRRL Y-2460]
MSETDLDLEKAEQVLNEVSNATIKWIDRFSIKLAYTLYDNQFVRNHKDEFNPQFLTYISMLFIAVSLIIVGSYATVEKPKNALTPSKYHPLFDQSDKDQKSFEETNLTEKNAILMPVIGCITLLGLYHGLKNLSPETLSYYLNNYIMLMSINSNTSSINHLIKIITRKFCYWMQVSSLNFLHRYKLTLSVDEDIHSFGVEENYTLPEDDHKLRVLKEESLKNSRSNVLIKDQLFNFFFSTAELISIPLGLLISGFFYKFDGSKNWILSNCLGSFFTIFGIQSVRIGNFKTSFIMLLGLFIYDIYFVFGSDVMVTVAKGIDIPVKLLIPNLPLPELDSETSLSSLKLPMSMLGLGDIVVPGVFISLCLRFDLWRFHNFNKDLEFHHLQPFPKPYFITSLIGYIFGLVTTMGALHVSQQGQPALLYLCPSLSLSVIGLAILKGELKLLWNYEEADKDDDNSDSDSISAYKVSSCTLRLLELDDEDEEEEEKDDDYIFQDDGEDDYDEDEEDTLLIKEELSDDEEVEEKENCAARFFKEPYDESEDDDYEEEAEVEAETKEEDEDEDDDEDDEDEGEDENDDEEDEDDEDDDDDDDEEETQGEPVSVTIVGGEDE